MDIAAIVNPVSDALPRRSSSNSHVPPSPATSLSKLPTSPPPQTAMPHKRKRRDPKPIWAYREHEELEGEALAQEERRRARQQPRPQQAATRSQQPSPLPNGQRIPFNAPQTIPVHELSGYERPLSNDAHVYDEISRAVCDFIWRNVVANHTVRAAIAESDITEVEVEARWGQIMDRQSGKRLRGLHGSECVLRKGVSDTKFESVMTLEQHKRMNGYLNSQSQQSQNPPRAPIAYQHTKEIDVFYELGQDEFNMLPDMVKRVITQTQQRQRIRVTRDAQGNVLRKVIKLRIENMEISSPCTEWDYRIGINLEVKFPGSIENLVLVKEPGKSEAEMERKKDRMSYRWLDAYQVDLTQVRQGASYIHELELELSAQVLLENAERSEKGEDNSYENLITGMMNNLRVLSREITPPMAG